MKMNVRDIHLLIKYDMISCLNFWDEDSLPLGSLNEFTALVEWERDLCGSFDEYREFFLRSWKLKALLTVEPFQRKWIQMGPFFLPVSMIFLMCPLRP